VLEFVFIIVTDIGTRVCVDPGGNGATMNVGGEGGPGPPGGEEVSSDTRQQRRLVVLKMLEDKEDGLGTTSRLHYAQSMYHCMHSLMIVVMSSVLLVYLFQENKSYGSTKPFVFILWCTRTRVGNNNAYVKTVLHLG
jgi:hypothetical protein